MKNYPTKLDPNWLSIELAAADRASKSWPDWMKMSYAASFRGLIPKPSR